MEPLRTAESPQKERPRKSLAAINQGPSKIKHNLYSKIHQRAQTVLQRRYGLNKASAVLTADMLTGGANG